MYSLFVVLSVTLGLIMSFIKLKKIGLTRIQIMILCISISTGFIAGARLFNFIIRYRDYKVLEISLFAPKLAYFSIYGGIIAVFIIIIVYASIWKLDRLLILDELSLPFLLSFSVMKLGCYLNGCCYGTFTNSWMGISPPSSISEELASSKLFGIASQTMKLKVYPTQFMEMGAAIFIVIFLVLFRKKLYKGSTFFIAATSFSLARLIILPYRASVYTLVVTELIYPSIYISIVAISILLLVHLKP